MVMPLRDDDTDRRTVPVVTYALIAVNVLVWLVEIGLGEKFINGYSTIPFEITHNTDLVGMRTVQAGGQGIPIQLYPGPTPIYLTLLFSMFMHASWAHIIGNMLYLWIFGDNIEDRIAPRSTSSALRREALPTWHTSAGSWRGLRSSSCSEADKNR